jgi:hypothetical protein
VFAHQKGLVTCSIIVVAHLDTRGFNAKIQHVTEAIQQFVQAEETVVHSIDVHAMPLTLEIYVNTLLVTVSIQVNQAFVLEKELVKNLINVIVKLDTREIIVNLQLAMEIIL